MARISRNSRSRKNSRRISRKNSRRISRKNSRRNNRKTKISKRSRRSNRKINKKTQKNRKQSKRKIMRGGATVTGDPAKDLAFLTFILGMNYTFPTTQQLQPDAFTQTFKDLAHITTQEDDQAKWAHIISTNDHDPLKDYPVRTPPSTEALPLREVEILRASGYPVKELDDLQEILFQGKDKEKFCRCLQNFLDYKWKIGVRATALRGDWPERYFPDLQKFYQQTDPEPESAGDDSGSKGVMNFDEVMLEAEEDQSKFKEYITSFEHGTIKKFFKENGISLTQGDKQQDTGGTSKEDFLTKKLEEKINAIENEDVNDILTMILEILHSERLVVKIFN